MPQSPIRKLAPLAEKAKVAVRSIRRDSNEKLKSMKKSGEITDALAHVLTTLFLPLSFIARIFFSSDTLIYGPFFNERLIIYT